MSRLDVLRREMRDDPDLRVPRVQEIRRAVRDGGDPGDIAVTTSTPAPRPAAGGHLADLVEALEFYERGTRTPRTSLRTSFVGAPEEMRQRVRALFARDAL